MAEEKKVTLFSMIMMSVFVMIFSTMMVMSWKNFLEVKPHTTITKGCVTDMKKKRKGNKSYEIAMQFSGRQVKLKADAPFEWRIGKLNIGDSVFIAWNPEQPDKARFNFGEELHKELLFALPLSLLWLLTLLMWKYNFNQYRKQ